MTVPLGSFQVGVPVVVTGERVQVELTQGVYVLDSVLVLPHTFSAISKVSNLVIMAF